MPSVGSSSHEQPGVHHEAARDREHLLLAPGEGAARLLHALLQARKAREHVVLAARVGLAGQADAQVLEHREVREDAAALRHVADSEARHLPGLHAREVHPVELDRARAAPREAHDGAQRGGLAHAVAAEKGHRFAGADLERYAAQDVQLSVVHLHAGELKHAPRPRRMRRRRDGRGRPRARARRPLIACGVPRASTAPCAMTVMSSASPNTTSMSCSMMMMSTCLESVRIFCTVFSVSTGLMPQVGSSSSRSFGDDHQRHADLEERHVAVGKRAGNLAAHGGEADLLEHAVDLLAHVGEARGRAERVQEALARLGGDPQVVGDAQVREHALDLHRALDAAPADLVRLQARDVLPGEEHAAGVGRLHARDDVEERRLPRAVGPDDGVHAPAFEGDVDVVDRHQAAEAPGEPLRAQDGFAHVRARLKSRSMSVCHRPTKPRGANMTIRMAMKPTISR